MANSILRKLIRLPFIGRLILTFQRSRYPLKQYIARGKILFQWLIQSKETTNYTYNLTSLNKEHLAATLANTMSVEYNIVWRYITEIEADKKLASHIYSTTEKHEHSFVADKNVKFLKKARLVCYS